MAAGSGEINFTVWSLVWILILWFIGWPLAFFISWWYILLLPFAVCVPALKEIMELLLKIIHFPQICAEGVVSGNCNFTIWSVVWFLVLIFIGWPIACFVAWWYIFLMPFGVCIDALKDIMDLLEKIFLLPKLCGEGMVSGKSLFD